MNTLACQNLKSCRVKQYDWSMKRMMSINNRVKQIRKSLNLTQRNFAEKISISTGYLAGIESGHKNANERITRLIAHEFNIDEHWLKTGQGAMFNSNLNASIVQMISIFKSLSSPLQECALKQIKALHESNII